MASSDTLVALRAFGADSHSHAHDHYQIVWGLDGLVEIELEHRGARMGSGQVLAIAPGERHEFHAPQGARVLVMNAAQAGHNARLEPVAGTLRLVDDATNHLLRYLASLPALPTSASELLLASLAGSREALQRSLRRAIAWSELRIWIDAHLERELDVATLAARVHLSPTQFAARCMAELGLTPMGLVRQHRLRAARRLRAAGLSVAAVAWRCGYRSPSALTAALKRDASC